MRQMLGVVMGAFGVAAVLVGCQHQAPSYPFRGSWVDLSSEGLGLVLEANGDASARGNLPEGFACGRGEPLWVAGAGHWEADTEGRVQVYLGPGATEPLPVDAQMPFGEPSWTTVFVGVCGQGSQAGEFIELEGKVASP